MSDHYDTTENEPMHGNLRREISRVAQNKPDEAEDDADQQLLWLLDSVDQLLRLREALAESLSNGWMGIATARYSVAPSCISQPVFSLKPCSAATVVSVSHTEDVGDCEEEVAKAEGRWRYIDLAPQFVLRQKCKGTDMIGSDVVERSFTMGLRDSAKPRQRQLSGVSKEKYFKAAGNGEKDFKVEVNGDLILKALDTERVTNVSGVSSLEKRNLNQRSNALAWLGALVSPRPQTAQASFEAALEILVKMATVQSAIQMACSEII